MSTPAPPQPEGLGTVISVLVGLITVTAGLYIASDRIANPKPTRPPPADALALPAEATPANLPAAVKIGRAHV